MLLACGGPDKPTDGTSQERSTAEPTDLPDSERATDEPGTPVSPGRMPSTPESGDAPTATDAPVPATAPPAASGSAETDREALVAIYNATDGENWNRSDNWLSDAPLDEWEGVTTDDEGRVAKLEVNGNDLTGEIPAELGNLTNLTHLSLSFNQLTGAIPAELGDLTNLQTLYLDGNQLTGEISAELGDLTNLTHLDLYLNQLTGEIPAELGSLPSLEGLQLHNNPVYRGDTGGVGQPDQPDSSVPLQQPVDRVHTRRLAKHTGQ